MLCLTFDADSGPRYGLQPGGSDIVLALHTDAVNALIVPVNGFLEGPEQFRIRLFQGQPYVKVAFLARLVDPIAALRTWLGSRRSDRGGGEQVINVAVVVG